MLRVVVAVLAAAAVALAGPQPSWECPDPPADPTKFNPHAAGYVLLGERAEVPLPVAGLDVVLGSGSVVKTVVAGGAIDVDFNAEVTDGYLFASDLDKIYFEQNLEPQAVACDGPAAVPLPAPCPAPDASVCAGVERRRVSVWPRTTRRIGITEFCYGSVTVGSGATLVLENSGVYVFDLLTLSEDSTLVLRGNGAPDAYWLFVRTNIVLRERVRIVREGAALERNVELNLVQYEDQPGFGGSIVIREPPADRDHELRVNLCSNTSVENGGLIWILHRQTIIGTVRGQGDIIVDNDAVIITDRAPAHSNKPEYHRPGWLPLHTPHHVPLPHGGPGLLDNHGKPHRASKHSGGGGAKFAVDTAAAPQATTAGSSRAAAATAKAMQAAASARASVDSVLAQFRSVDAAFAADGAAAVASATQQLADAERKLQEQKDRLLQQDPLAGVRPGMRPGPAAAAGNTKLTLSPIELLKESIKTDVRARISVAAGSIVTELASRLNQQPGPPTRR